MVLENSGTKAESLTRTTEAAKRELRLELIQTRKRLEHRMCFDSQPYGVAAKVEKIDAELETIEHSEGRKEVGA